MTRAIFLAIAILSLLQGLFVPGRGPLPIGPPEAAAAPVLHVRSMHPLPDWDGPEDLQPRGNDQREEAPGSRLKISLPVALLALLLFFLMWKFLQSQV